MKFTLRRLLAIFILLFFCQCIVAQDIKFFASDKMSSNQITCFCQDSYGYIWVGTEYGLNRYDGYKFNTYLHSNKCMDSTINDNEITCLFEDSFGTLFVGTNSGCAYYNREKDYFIPIRISKDVIDIPRIECFLETCDGKLLAGTSSYGLYEIVRETFALTRISKYSSGDNDDFYMDVFQDASGRIWKCDNYGVVSCFTPDENPKLILREKSNIGNPIGFFETSQGVIVVCKEGILMLKDGKLQIFPLVNYDIVSAHKLTENVLLLGTKSEGILYINVRAAGCEVFKECIPTATVMAIYTDKANNIWAGIQNKGLALIPSVQPVFCTWNMPPDNCYVYSTVNSACLAQDNTMWCCMSDGFIYQTDTTGKVLNTFKNNENTDCISVGNNGKMYIGTKNGVYSFNKSNFQKSLVTKYNCSNTSEIVENIEANELYAATFGNGLEIIDLATLKSENMNMYQTSREGGYLCNNWINDMFLDGEKLWIATVSGTTCYDTKNKTFFVGSNHNVLEGKNCSSIKKYSKNEIVIGTNGGLFIYNTSKNTVDTFPNSQVFENITIKKILDDSAGGLWISTSNGIWHYKKDENIFIAHINDVGLSDREYIKNIGLKLTNDLFIFGNSKGFTAFNPAAEDFRNYNIPQPVLSDVYISGKKLLLSQRETPVLSYGQNYLDMEFTTFDYPESDNIVFEYSLNGSPMVSLPHGHNTVMLYNLPVGKYEMKIRACQNGYCSDYKTIGITVMPPWYKTPIAYVFYIILFSAIAYYIFMLVKQRKKQKNYEEKTQLLINATHDIRTPLTMIISPLHQLINEEKSQANLQKLQTINHNANRILNLVNQILYLRKFDKKKTKLVCRLTDLGNYIFQSVKLFDEAATSRNINFNFSNPEQPIEAYIDTDNFDKVIVNLISNAFKYTPDGGNISVKLERKQSEENEFAVITVEDSGQGLNENDIKNIFNRFYQTDSRPIEKTEGTGIGLNICKIIVEQHHGQISAQNRKDTHGSVFTVTIPLGKSHLSDDEIQQTPPPIVSAPESVETKKNTTKKYKILVVDDDQEICDYISQQLSKTYTFVSCNNGEEALKILLEQEIDLVVSDIMMPRMDGFTLLRMIKSNVNINHIPVILLTSRAEIANRLEGLNKGADGFMAKPFVIDELQMLMKNILDKMVVLKGKFSGNQQILQEKIGNIDVEDVDKTLMDKIIKSINNNLADPDFNVEALASDIGMSRVQLHRKLKDLAGINASDLIRNIRLEQAGRLIKEKKANVSQVAYSVGFNNLGHFSKIFKNHFGVSPSEYAKNS